MPRFRKAQSGEGERKNLPEGTYKIAHKYTTKDWEDGKGPVLQLELRKADDENCVMWLSGGRCVSEDGEELVSVSKDGKTLSEDSEISPRCRMAGYLEAFSERAKLPIEECFDLNVLDAYECQISLQPNPSAMAKAGSKIPVLVGVNPPKAAAKTGQSGSRKSKAHHSASNGEADDVVAGFTSIQLQALEALERFEAQGEGDLTIAALRPFTLGVNPVEEVKVARAAMTDIVQQAWKGTVPSRRA